MKTKPPVTAVKAKSKPKLKPTPKDPVVEAGPARERLLSVTLDVDVSKAFSSSTAVNEALRLLMHAANIVRAPADEVPGLTVQTLTPAETDIAFFAAKGMSNARIAQVTGLAEGTITNYVYRIISKLGCFEREAIGDYLP